MEDHRSVELDVVTTAEEPVYESVRCSRCAHVYPLVSREVDNGGPDLCEECRGALFAADHAEPVAQQPHR